MVRFRVDDVVLEVDARRRQDGDGSAPGGGVGAAAAGQSDDALPGAAAGGRDVVGDVLGDVVVELRVPRRVGVLQRVVAEFLQGCAGLAAVEVVVELDGVSTFLERVGKGELTGPKVRSKPLVMLGVPFPWWLEATCGEYLENM